MDRASCRFAKCRKDATFTEEIDEHIEGVNSADIGVKFSPVEEQIRKNGIRILTAK